MSRQNKLQKKERSKLNATKTKEGKHKDSGKAPHQQLFTLGKGK
jgi:hypothetical protein